MGTGFGSLPVECRDRPSVPHPIMRDMGIETGKAGDFPVVLYLLTNKISLSTKYFSYLQ